MGGSRYSKFSAYLNVYGHKMKTKYAIQHKRETTIELIDYDNSILEKVKQLYKNARVVEKTGKKYRVVSIKEKRGESIAFYFYHGKVIARIWTHNDELLEKLLEILHGKVIRELIELYIRYHERSERRVEQILEAILRKYGKSQSIKYHMHKTRKIAYLNRLNKFKINGLTIAIKTYRHRAYSSLKHNDQEYHPKLEISILKKGEIKQEDIRKALAILNTIVKLARIKQIWSEYDKQQKKYPLTTLDTELYRVLKGTIKRIKAINILGREYYDINHAILDLIKRGLKIREIARVLGYDHKAILYRINKFIDKGIVRKTGRGKYEVISKLEKPKITRKGDIKKFIELYKQRKLDIKKMIAVEEDIDIVTIWTFPTIRLMRVANYLLAIDQELMQIARIEYI